MSRPVVCVDARMIRGVPHGIGQYVVGMAKGFKELARVRQLPYELIFLVDESHGKDSFEGWAAAPSRYRFLHRSEILGVPHEVHALGASLFVNPSFASFLGLRCPWIQIVHDLNHLHFGGKAKRLYYQLLLKRSLRAAEKVMSISAFARGEIAQWLNWDESRIALAPNPLWREAEKVENPGRGREALQGLPYILSLGNEKPHKNLEFFREVFVAARRKHPHLQEWRWVVTIPDWDDEDNGIVATQALGTSAVLPWMSGAAAVACPSIYEGFGRVPLEALLAGTQVLASNIAAHREGLAEFAEQRVQFLPLHADAWIDALGSLQSRAHGWDEIRQSELAARILDTHSPLRTATAVHDEILGAL